MNMRFKFRVPVLPAQMMLILDVLFANFSAYLFLLVFFKVVCVGSIKELEELSGVKVSDLHRER